MQRSDGRKSDQLRPVKVVPNFQKFALGSCLIEFGNTKVICAASLEERVPLFLKGQGKGWLTAEYGMLPASCSERIQREVTRGKASGRTHEIQRLIGRALRSVMKLDSLGERTMTVDCDVLQGDGGTRTAAITGGFIALCQALKKLLKNGLISEWPVKGQVAAVSVGMVNQIPRLDLCYEEDSKAEVDMNVVMTDEGKFVEVQGTAEGKPFSQAEMTQLMNLAKKGIRHLFEIQRKYIHLK